MTYYNREMLEFIHNETEAKGFATISNEYHEILNILIEKGFVETNPNGTDEKGNFLVALTDNGEIEYKENSKPMTIGEMAARVSDENSDTGKQHGNSINGESVPKSPVFTEPKIVAPTEIQNVQVITGLKPPAEKLTKVGRKGGPEIFPFSTMEIGTAFYITPTLEIQKPEQFYKTLVNQKNQAYKIKKFNADGSPAMYERNSTKYGPKMVQEKELTREYAIYPAKDVPDSPYSFGAWIFRLK